MENELQRLAKEWFRIPQEIRRRVRGADKAESIFRENNNAANEGGREAV